MANEKTLTKAGIEQERAALKQRLADLDAAERVLDSMSPAYVSAADILTGPDSPSISIKKVILTETMRLARGVSAAEIAAVISALKGEDYPVRNVSPKLSLYGSEGLIAHHDGLWRITSKGVLEYSKLKD